MPGTGCGPSADAFANAAVDAVTLDCVPGRLRPLVQEASPRNTINNRSTATISAADSLPTYRAIRARRTVVILSTITQLSALTPLVGPGAMGNLSNGIEPPGVVVRGMTVAESVSSNRSSC